MAGITLSFVADPHLADRVRDIANADDITRSQAAARAVAVGALLPTAARRTLRTVLSQGDEQTYRELANAMAQAIAKVGNALVERRLLEQARDRGLSSDETEEELAEMAVKAVADHRRRRAEGR